MVQRSSRWQTAGAMLLFCAMTSCGGGTGNDATVPAHDVEIVPDARDLGPNAFTPPNAGISLATQSEVTWYNADFSGYGGLLGTVHHLKSDDGTTFDSGMLAPNETFHATFSAPGTYTYHCEIHTGMTGTITVNP